ncbi:transposase [Sugiyamaella lignohabitans]|uniref:Transposase n=1 Tax=Sugiyamaella lignohabitans TaxID=796027 RepID=A0A167CLZ8_9ASCO|nr:transposase [Sugiyamaella lignohabitans]ANB11872.1 transposase [Sugiyamaella lignohabitans]
MLFKNSITVTSDPRRDQTEAISRPIIPPPIMANFLGTSVNERIPVEVTIFFSSTSIPGKGVGSEPVAIMMFLAFKLTFSEPSRGSTSISFSLTKLPVPLK